jgi:hypothetical protein
MSFVSSLNQLARKGKLRKENQNAHEKTDWESRHLGGGNRDKRDPSDGGECREHRH